MTSLQSLTMTDRRWSLEELVQVANQLLPQYLPQEARSGRPLEEVNPRLVRHYTTLGLLDKPLKVGREARYIYRHIIQLLVVRRLLTEGYSAQVLSTLMTDTTTEDLEALLQGGVQLTLGTANPALVGSLRALPTPVRNAVSEAPADTSEGGEARPTRLTRLEVIPGLEVQVREEFTYPSSLQERQALLELIGQQLLQVTRRRRRVGV